MPNADGSLTQEEFDSLSPSDRAHYKVKGRTGDGFSSEDDTDATKTARAAAFELPNVQADGDSTDREARANDLEKAKEDAGVSGFDSDEEPAPEDTSEPTGDGITDEGGSGHPQTPEEAADAEYSRREGMSDVERAEAEARDEHARALAHEDSDEDADIPNVGSRQPERTEE